MIVPVFVIPPGTGTTIATPVPTAPLVPSALTVPELTIAPVKTPVWTIALLAVPTVMPIALSPAPDAFT